MKRSAMFEKLKAYYDSGLWDKYRVHNAVIKGKITETEFEEITGDKYNG